MQKAISYLSGIIFLAAFFPYIRAILRKQTVPSKASWIIWASLDSITLAAMWTAGTMNGQIVGAMAGAWIVAILSLFYGKAGWTHLDIFCLGGGALGVGLWWLFNNPVIGIVVSVTVVFLAAFPTFRTGWQEPEKEDRTAWTLYWISCMLALIAIPTWTLGNAAQPISFSVIETTMLILLWRPRPT